MREIILNKELFTNKLVIKGISCSFLTHFFFGNSVWDVMKMHESHAQCGRLDITVNSIYHTSKSQISFRFLLWPYWTILISYLPSLQLSHASIVPSLLAFFVFFFWLCAGVNGVWPWADGCVTVWCYFDMLFYSYKHGKKDWDGS